MPLCADENGAILVGDENKKTVGNDDNIDDNATAADGNNENVSDISRLKWTFFFSDHSQNDDNGQVYEEQVDEEKAGAEQAGEEQAGEEQAGEEQAGDEKAGEARGESERTGGEQADDQQVDGQASDAA